MSFVHFLKSKVFFINLGIAVITLFLIFFILNTSINSYTRHNKHVEVPDFSGLPTLDLDRFIKDKHVVYQIIDSVYDSKKPRGTVIEQDPIPGTKVKSGRKVYVTINSLNPEKIGMPNLIDLSLRQAIAILETAGLKAGRLRYVPDIAKNAVLKQEYKGVEIAPGTLIEKGSTINLVIGRGEGRERIIVPNLYGLTRTEAIRLLNNNSLNIGSEVFDKGCDSTEARIYMQRPLSKKGNEVGLGASVDLWYKAPDKFIEQTEPINELDELDNL